MCFVEKSVVKCQPTLPLISCYRRAVSQVQGCMVNNRNVSTLVSPLNYLFTVLASLLDLDINLSPSGTIVKKVGETLDLTLQIDASEDSKVSWTKVKAIFLNNKAEKNNDK